MPALKIYGRRWHMASDMMPIPALAALVIHTIWIIVFGPLVGAYHVFGDRACHKPGVQYQAVCGGFLAIYAVSWVFELALFVVGCRGTPLEVQKRKAVVPLLYVMSFLWLAQTVLAVYGTAVVHHVAPGCWTGADARSVVHIAQGMTYTTWALTALLILCIFTIYNAYPEHNKQENWERRCLCVSWLCGCAQDMQQKVEGKGAPMTSIAQWISGLFGSVDLAPSDITAALVLAAAAQRRRRKNRIKKALNPIIKAASNAATSQTSDQLSEDTASIDDRSDLEEDDSSLDDIPEGDEDIEAPPPSKRQQREGGQLNADSKGQSAVAMPADYPEEWKKKFEAGYQQTAQSIARVSPDKGRSGRTTPKAGPPPGKTPERRNDDNTSDALPHSDTHELGGVPAQHVSHDEAVVDAQLEQKQQRALERASRPGIDVASQSSGLEDGQQEVNRLSPFARISGGAELFANSGTVVSLSQLNPEMLEDARGSQAVPVGLEGADAPGFQRAASVDSEHDYVTVGPDGVPTAGLLQAGMNEPSGALGAPSELSLQHTTYSGKLLDDHGVPLADSAHPQLQQVADTDLIGPDSKPTDDMGRAASIAIPLERQISFKFPTVITPSEQAEDVRIVATDDNGGVEHVLTAKQAAKAYAGSFNAVDLSDLETASHYVKYAVASYAIIPVTENPEKNRFQRSPLTCGVCAKKDVVSGDSITADILKLADLEPDELLYWSHDNRALSHLPYMIILDKEKKAVVVAIRGTSSIADLVTDAVVHPEPMEDWVPQDYVKNNGPLGAVFGHAGMVSSAEAILKDMEEHGVLQTLLQGADYKGQEDENTGEGVGAKMAKALDGKNYQLVVTGHSLGAGTAALVGLKLKARFPDIRTWAFNPPGGLVTRNLNKVLDTFCTSLVVGKDAVSRGTVNNLSRLMDEMVTALARCRYHKLHVIMGGWWWKERRPAPDSLFCPYSKIPREARALLERYHLAQERKGRALNMYPPGRIIFLRPIKVRTKRKHGGEGKLVKRWDAVWVSPREVVGEGILVSKRMLEDHLSEKALIPALRFVAENHPQRLAKPEAKQQQESAEADKFQDNLHEIVVDGMDPRTRTSGRGSTSERQMTSSSP